MLFLIPPNPHSERLFMGGGQGGVARELVLQFLFLALVHRVLGGHSHVPTQLLASSFSFGGTGNSRLKAVAEP